jgi:hypothetical protein
MELARAHGGGPMAAKTAGSVNVGCGRFARSRSAATAAGAPGIGTRANTTMRSFPPIAPRACRHGRTEALATRRRCPDAGAAQPAGQSVSGVMLTASAKNRFAFAHADRGGARTALAATRAPASATWQRRRPV